MTEAISFEELESRVPPEQGRRLAAALHAMTLHARGGARQRLSQQLLRATLGGACVTFGSFLSVILSTGALAPSTNNTPENRNS